MPTLPEKIDSKFRYVLLAAQRAENLVQTRRHRPEAEVEKPVLKAMREVRTDQVEWDYGPPPEGDGSTEADA